MYKTKKGDVILENSYVFEKNANVIVVGGGPAGIIAATAAARLGAKTILLERYGFLGGNATAGLVGRFWGLYHRDQQIVFGLPQEFLNKLKEAGGLAEPNDFMPVEGDKGIDLVTRVIAHDSETLKCVADQFVLESGTEIIFHAQMTHVIMDKNVVKAVEIETPEGKAKITGKIVVDCTGDGTAAIRAGAKDLNEGVSQLQPPSMPFRVSNIVLDEFLALTREEKQAIIKRGLEKGVLTTVVFGGSITPVTGAPGTMHIMMTRIAGINAVKTEDLTKGEISGRKQVKEVMEFLRAEVPGFKNANIMQIAPHIAVRETRIIEGEKLVTGDQAREGYRSVDTVALASGPIDMHDKGTGFNFMEWPKQAYGIPYGALIPKGLKNMLMAGRCISADRMANAGIRHMGICMSTGHSAGVAAGLAIRNHQLIPELSAEEIRAELLHQNAFLG